MGIHTNYQKYRAEEKLRRRERRDDEARQNRLIAPAPPLVVTLIQDVGKLPAGIVLQLPEAVSSCLIMRRLARPAAFAPDVVFTAEDMDHAAFETDAVWLASCPSACAEVGRCLCDCIGPMQPAKGPTCGRCIFGCICDRTNGSDDSSTPAEPNHLGSIETAA